MKLFVNDIPIKQVSHNKLLGIHIDESLTWNLQVANIKKYCGLLIVFSKEYTTLFDNPKYKKNLTTI